MNRRQKIIVSVVGIFIVLLALVGLTYAYFLTRVIGNGENKSISVTTASLQLVYDNGSSSLIQDGTLISPNSDEPVGTKTFTVTNNGNGRVDNYGVFLEEFAIKYANDTVIDGVEISAGTPTIFASPSDMKLDIVCKSYKTSEYNSNPATATASECSDMDVLYTTLPTSNDMLLSNGIDVGVTHEYTVTLTYLETGLDQSDDMNKTIEGLIQIYGLNDVIDIEGTVTGANTGDYAQLNSEPKKSQIINGKYKFTGVKPGNHTFSIFSKDGVLRGSKPFTIKMGKVANTDNGIITINEESKSVSINIPSISTTLGLNIGNITQTEAKPTTPFGVGTLAEAIYKNAEGVTDEEMATGIAKLHDPLSTPAEYVSEETEATLSWTDDDYTETTEIPSYYFRGNVKNNYVNFAGMCWRIVRIGGDRTTKLILEDQYTTCNDTETETTMVVYTGNWNIGTGNYGYDSSDKSTSGLSLYKMNYLNPVTGNASSMVKAFYDFQITKLEDYTGKLKSGDWCLGDKAYTRSGSSGSYTYTLLEDTESIYLSNKSFYYDAYTRLTSENVNGYQPTLKCKGTILNEFADVSGVSSKLPMYVSTITADEIVYAGGKYGEVNGNYYVLNNYQNSNQFYFWSLSPSHFYSDLDYALRVNDAGELKGGFVNDPRLAFRPAVSLSHNVSAITNSDIEQYGLPGTQTNPYVIE